TARRVASANRSWRENTFSRPSSCSMSIAVTSPCNMLVAGVYGEKFILFAAIMSSHEKNDFGSVAFLLAASALLLTALNDMPGGSISPFCAPPIVTSTPHSSWRWWVWGGEGDRLAMKHAGWAAPA